MDLGKMLVFFDEPQWAIVGDTFPVGCAYSDKIVLPEFFKNNPDYNTFMNKSKLGIYQAGCGLDQVHMSWGHDEYLYQVMKEHLPTEALYVIRYHSFYAAHTFGEYEYLMNDKDKEYFKWVKRFNQYDLYSKDPNPVDIEALLPYYRDLVRKYFPNPIRW